MTFMRIGAPTRFLPIDVRLMAFFYSLLTWVLSAMMLAGVGLWVVRHPIWALSSIELHGDVKYQNPERFRSRLVSKLQGNFLTVDLKEVQILAQSVPWVRRAVVKRVFPNRLSVTLEEHEAFAWWQTADGSSLVNVQGEVFDAFDAEDELDDIPELAGPEEQVHQIKATYERIRPWFLSLGLPIWRLELTAQGEWQVGLRNGAWIALGRGDIAGIEIKVQRFVLTLPKVMSQFRSELEAADLRYPQAYAVRLKGVGTVHHPTPLLQEKQKALGVLSR